MGAWFLRVSTVVALPLSFVVTPAPAAAQQPGAPRSMAVVVEPVISTKIEALLAATNTVVMTDHYYIDTRFGPNLRIDAIVVEAVDARERLKGLRVQVSDKNSRGRQEGTSYMDHDELVRLSRGLASMSALAAKWTGNDDRRANELSFTSAGGFRLAIRQSARVPRAYLSTGLLDPVVTSIEIIELDTLKEAFDQALAILNSK